MNRCSTTTRGGQHRVIFYGDRVEDIRLLSQLANFKVIEEC